MDVNPYAPVTGKAVNSPTSIRDDADAESIRRKHLSHEASVKSFGVLHILVGVLSVLWGALMFHMGLVGLARTSSQNVSESIFSVVLGVVVVVLGIAYTYAGLCMRSLNQSGKVLAIVMAAVGLLAVPFGTLISLYILWVLLSEKGSIIFSPSING
ncbi:MAG: hypothetical protein NTW52_07780 [Planctomycetota bacterium]|nr:hypothetical protein [Planctomycetota bacterium]